MATGLVSSADLDYLQRTGYHPPPLGGTAQFTLASPEFRSLVRVRGIGRLDKVAPAAATERFRLITEDLITGLYNDRTHLAFILRGMPGNVSVEIGTWLPGGAPSELVQSRRVLASVVASLYPSIDIVDAPTDMPKAGRGALVLGIPTAKPPDLADGALPIDRLVRAMAGQNWVVMVLAQPIEETVARDLRLRVINEMRATQTAAQTAGIPSPLADYYTKLLEIEMLALTQGQGIGLWRTAVYLLGDDESHYSLSSSWRGIFAGADSVPEPVRVWQRPEVTQWAQTWAMPDPVATPEGTNRGLQHPFSHQTLLTSTQLAAYVHLPSVETGGFSVTVVPDFDTVQAVGADDAFSVGEVLERGRRTGRPYTVSPRSLTRHAFVGGVTGSGKTNSIFHLLQQTESRGVPFMVIEPAKTEYRALLADSLIGSSLQVFTLGDETVSPFRLNPFEFPDGIHVGVHIDLLRSVFNVSFGMWTPLPQVIEICFHEIFEDRGWDIGANTNRRLDNKSDRHAAFPTMTDLVSKVDDVSRRLGYEERVTADIRAALRTRLNSLRTGAKGRMLDVRKSIPADVLLGRPTILELEMIGDDEDKAFVMGLILIRLAEERRVAGEREQLIHVLVIEEAHRLLGAASPRVDETQGDVRGKAVETFVNLMSEVRAYGQGILIADQVPSRLAPDVIKNTNLKLVHRIVAGDDRSMLASAMAMNERQERALATFTIGEGVSFADGDDAPILVQVPLAKGPAEAIPTGADVRNAMAARGDTAALRSLMLPSFDCAEACLAAPAACESARGIIANTAFVRTFARTVLATVEDCGAYERLRPDLEDTIERLRPPWIDPTQLMPVLEIHAARAFAQLRGAQAGWTFGETDRFADALRAILTRDDTAADADIEDFRACAAPLLGPRIGPFPACARIWVNEEHPCRCRLAVAELVRSGALTSEWEKAHETDSSSASGLPASWQVAMDAAYVLTEFPESDWSPDLARPVALAARRVAICFGQQMLAGDPALHPRTARRRIDALLDEARLA